MDPLSSSWCTASFPPRLKASSSLYLAQMLGGSFLLMADAVWMGIAAIFIIRSLRKIGPILSTREALCE
ncbi:hypothetical protein TYRP_013919 [Tyrophagus putrescentiae]|nr:hypothetical protein TYRP_013919 [Tyrophagus putrescentiae]